MNSKRFSKFLQSVLDKRDFFYHNISNSLLRALDLFLVIFIINSTAFAIPKPKKIGTVPFETVGSYIVVKAKINQSTPLNFILDTGLRNIIITELFSEDSISLQYISEINLKGLGSGNELSAFESNNNILKVGNVNLHNIKVLVLKEDIFNLSKQTGSKINGLIGIDFFEDYLVQINHSNKRINFFETEFFLSPKGYGMMPITIESKKMYLQLSVLVNDSVKRSVKMLIDTGAELNAWFQTITNESVHLPQKSVAGRIGQGLNGEVKGKFARLPQLCIGKFCLKNPIVAFPDSSAISEIIMGTDRDGTIGNQLLSRFNTYIDYKNKQFFYKPNENFKKPFTYNIAGIEIEQPIAFLPQLEVLNVWKNSPADSAGVKIGDQIMEVNGVKAFQMKINEMKMLFETPSKHPLNLLLVRDNKEIRLKIIMKRKI